MKNTKLMSLVFAVCLLVSNVGNAFGAIIFGDAQDTDTVCTETKDTTKVDNGVIVTLTGVIVTLTGVIVTFNEDAKDTNTDCGIIITD